MTTGNRKIIYTTDTADNTISGNTYHTYDTTTTAGNIYYDTSDVTWYHNTWITPNITPTPTTITWDSLPSDKWLDDIFTPVKCMCCNIMIKDESNGLHIELGKKTFWFHRRCFTDKRNSKFIRSLIVSEDLGLL